MSIGLYDGQCQGQSVGQSDGVSEKRTIRRSLLQTYQRPARQQFARVNTVTLSSKVGVESTSMNRTINVAYTLVLFWHVNHSTWSAFKIAVYRCPMHSTQAVKPSA